MYLYCVVLLKLMGARLYLIQCSRGYRLEQQVLLMGVDRGAPLKTSEKIVDQASGVGKSRQIEVRKTLSNTVQLEFYFNVQHVMMRNDNAESQLRMQTVELERAVTESSAGVAPRPVVVGSSVFRSKQ